MFAYFSVPARQKPFPFGSAFLRERSERYFSTFLALAPSAGLFHTDPQEIRQELQHA